MNRAFSIYLDFVRFFAAVLVLTHHMDRKEILLADAPLSGYGHSAVMLFFVLSGYVIAHVVATHERDIKSYAINRCARIYSVALPAVLLTPLLDVIGRMWSPELYAGHAPYDLWAIRAVSSLVFTNELWFVSIMSFSNLPYWSLNYEVWCYALFAVVHFTSGRRRIVFAGLILLVIGPKIALLVPIWWLGVFLYRNKWLRSVGETLGWVLVVISLILLTLFFHFSVEETARQWLRGILGVEMTHLLVSSQFFLSHYLLAVIIAMHFVGIRAIEARLSRVLFSLEKPIRFFANYTFALYLFHVPLIFFFGAMYQGDPAGWNYYIAIISSVVLAVFIIGQFTENKKSTFRYIFKTLFEYVSRILVDRKPRAIYIINDLIPQNKRNK